MSNLGNRVKRYKFIHLVPYDGVGGVEVAARSMGLVDRENIEFSICYIFCDIDLSKNKYVTYNPFWIFYKAWKISRSDVDFLILSLWRASIVGLIAKLMRPRIKIITFLHNSRDAHFFDFIVTRISVWASKAVWADSQATLAKRFEGIDNDKCQVISLVTRRFEAAPIQAVEPVFIFWGRITQQKDIERAIHFFSKVRHSYSNARFYIVGPDGGALQKADDLCVSLGLTDAVCFLGAATIEQIVNYARSASFYLQTSIYEGMAMSVVEAMQIGLVPIVTPVGEIGSYCRDGGNAVIVESDKKAIDDVLDLLKDNDRYQVLRANAIATWQDRPLYRDSVLMACQTVTRAHGGDWGSDI